MSANTRDTGLFPEQSSFREPALDLADHYGFELLTSEPREHWFLSLGEQGLSLVRRGPGSPGPVRVDFISGSLGHRRRFGGGRGQPLARAAGMKPGFNPLIWDATAGLGRDAFVLASLGCRVSLCERSPVLAALLEDGLRRANLEAETGLWVRERMTLIFADSSHELVALPEEQRPDVIYLDPMYPTGKIGVLVKKEMRALQQLLGEDQDSRELLDIALATAKRRVVVKRPKRAGWLHEIRPDTSIESKKTRYDLYITLNAG